ncbi:MAG: universal stress protein [Candidatus Bipolaricaulota bacterium]|nr:universal stress protein [Candidatus Bipolaricaulota bacterium]MBS3791764.1 universal stress protein [Candidatus Bipolaricaulota bacterium]
MGKSEFDVLHYLRGSKDYAALDFLASVLRGKGGNLQLIYVDERFPDIEDDSRRKLARKQHEETEKLEAKDVVNRAKAKLRETAPNFSVSSHTALGDPVEELLGQLDRNAFDLLSLEAHGRGGFRKNILGVHVNEFVQETPIPTIVHKGEQRNCERILIHVPNDRDRCADLLTYLTELFQGSDVAITLLTILTDGGEKFEGYISGEEDYLKRSIENYDRDEFGYLDIARKILNDRDLEAEVRYRIGVTQEEILTEAKEGRYDLMAFSPKKENILSSLWSGDKSLNLMQEIDISLLKYPEST